VSQTALDVNWRDLDRRIARLAVPALGAILAEPLYNLADTAIVGHLGRAPLDALAIATSALSIVAWLAIFLSTATTTEVSRNAARGRHGAAILAFTPLAALVLRYHWLGLPGVWTALGCWLAARAVLLWRRWASTRASSRSGRG
jgi:Na+-driven multidrug efflux pump